MRHLTVTALLIAATALHAATNGEPRHKIMLITDRGNICLELYNETPLHRDNFLSLVRSGYYDGNLFHRVIDNFMIQWGDSTTRHAAKGDTLGGYSPEYTVRKEIVWPQFFHKRGALAAAREGDSVNPERASSASQVYIVYGRRLSDEALDKVSDRISAATGGQCVLTDSLRGVYKRLGGTPHLDGQYTVFGEVIEGMDVVRSIITVETDGNDRPVDDIRILRAVEIREDEGAESAMPITLYPLK